MSGAVSGIIQKSGLNQSEVDARVVAVVSGPQHWFFGADAGITPQLNGTSADITAVGSSDFRVITCAQGVFSDGSINMVMPARWDAGSFRVRFYWLPSSTNTGYVDWGLYSSKASDGAAFPARALEASINDAGLGTALEMQISDWSSTFTVAGAVAGDAVYFAAARRTGDTFTGSAHLYGVQIEWTSNAASDN